MPTKITDHMFQYGSLKYFRGNAHLVELGCHGQKKDPIGAKAYLDPAGKIRAALLADRPIKQGTPVTIDWAEVKKANLESVGVLKYFGIGAKSAKSFDYELAKSARLELVNFSIAENPLKRCLNNDADTVRRSMFAEGNDARVVSEVWVVVDAELSRELKRNAGRNVDVTYAGNSLSISVDTGTETMEQIEIGEGTVFAYKMHKVKKWDKKTEKIEDLEADYKGMS